MYTIFFILIFMAQIFLKFQFVSYLADQVDRHLPYISDVIRLIFHKNKPSLSRQIYSLSFLGFHISLIGGFSALWVGKKTLLLTYIFAGALFKKNIHTARLIQELELILAKIEDNNKKLSELIVELKTSSQLQIDTLIKTNEDLKGEVKALEELIKATHLTVENLQKLKLEEKESYEKLCKINEKLAVVRELFEKERLELRKEVSRLSLEITRLTDVA